MCEKAWIYDRVPGYELVGYDQRVLNNVLTRMECQELCLEDTLLPCRSCEYDYSNKTCRLSQETRRTQPSAYRYIYIFTKNVFTVYWLYGSDLMTNYHFINNS